MQKLFLFDIDGTISRGGGENRFNRAINKVYDLDVNSERDFGGFTDQLILSAILEDEGWSSDQIAAALPRLIEEVDAVHKTTFRADSIKILPGVKELLRQLSAAGHVLGLVTGNLKPIAERKLEAIGIWDYFQVGGFGSDPHTRRAELVTVAIERAGFKDQKDHVVVIGDTDKDILAARAAHAGLAVGITNGLPTRAALLKAGADIVLDSFSHTNAVIEALMSEVSG